MAKEHPAPQGGKPDLDPENQTGEDKGRIKHEQLTDATMPAKDMPRGSDRHRRPS